MTEALRFWALIELIGLGAAPLAGGAARAPARRGPRAGQAARAAARDVARVARRRDDADPVRDAAAPSRWIALVCALGLLAWVRGWEGRRARRARRAARAGSRAGAGAGWSRACPSPTRCGARLFWGAEAVFAVAFAAMALLVAYSPDVWNTEKPMDMAFLNAANRAETFPPEDPWLAGADLNYYYLGHLAMAIVVKLTAVAPGRGLQRRRRGAVRAHRRRRVHGRRDALGAPRAGRAARCGAGARRRSRSCVVGGNLEGARLLIADGGPLREYDWFAASRVIDGHDHGVPVVLVPARRPARARAGAAVHAARARVRAAGRRSPGRGWRRAGGRCSRAAARRSRSASSTRSTPGRTR